MMFLVFCDLLRLIVILFVPCAWQMPLCLWCHIVIGFHGLLLVCFLFLPFMFEGLGNWFGKRKFNGAQ